MDNTRVAFSRAAVYNKLIRYEGRNEMRIVLCVVSAVYAALSAAAALAQMKKEKAAPSYLLMAAGGIGLIAAVVCCLARLKCDWVIALAGATLICAAAVWNGKRGGSFHWQHHAIRAALSAALLVGFILL